MSEQVVASVPSKLTRRQQRFIEAYLISWNASDAARVAGYKTKANVAGPRLMAKDSIKVAIEKRLDEAAMAANEVLARLSEQAKTNIADFISEDPKLIVKGKGDDAEEFFIESGNLDWEQVRRRGHLIKKISFNQHGPMLELHDSQAALALLGKHHKLFTENIDMTSGGKPLDDGIYERIMAKIQSRMGSIQSARANTNPDQPDQG